MTDQLSLDDVKPEGPKIVHARFNGPEYDPARDDDRLTKQIGRVFVAAYGETWHTIAELAAKTGDPENSVSAQLRHLRKPRFGGYVVERRSRRGPLFEYRVRPPEETA